MSSPPPAKKPHKHKHKSKSKDKGKDKERKRKHHHPEASSSASKKTKTRTTTTDTATSSGDSSNRTFHLVTTSLYLALSPKYTFFPNKAFSQLLAGSAERAAHLRALTPLDGVKKHHLEPMLNKYYEPADGVVIAYENIRFRTRAARIIAESPFAHIWVTVDLLVWRPRRGMVLEGWVNLQSPSHIGLLVENTWNVAIPLAKIPDAWEYREVREGFVSKYPPLVLEGAGSGNGAEGAGMEGVEYEDDDKATAGHPEDEGGWVDEDGEYVDGLLRFQVDSVKAGGSIFIIEGSLLDRAAIKNAVVESGKKDER